MKKTAIFALIFSFLLTVCSCAKTNDITDTTAVSSGNSDNGVVNYGSDSIDLNAIGGEGIFWDYAFRYYDISGELIRYVGNDDFQAWVRTGAEVNMKSFIDRYALSAEEIIMILNAKEVAEYEEDLSITDIEVLCSNDAVEINRSFCSPYAVVSESGDIYTIFWLAEHDAEDYAAAGISIEEVNKAVEACSELLFIETYVMSVESSAAELATIESAAEKLEQLYE